MKSFIKAILIVVILAFAISPSFASAYSGYPYFFIASVEKDKTVTITAYNFPANDSFTVTMGKYGTLGVGGIKVGTTESGKGGSFTATYTIPADLSGLNRIAIRLASSSSGYFAYNWFYNNTTGGSGGEPPTEPVKGCSTFPYFYIAAVTRDVSVTIKAHNFPPDDSFTVTMGAYGTKGVGGIVVDTQESDGCGTFTATYDIPVDLAGSNRIAIRLQSPTSGYYGYNWFYNNTAVVTVP